MTTPTKVLSLNLIFAGCRTLPVVAICRPVSENLERRAAPNAPNSDESMKIHFPAFGARIMYFHAFGARIVYFHAFGARIMQHTPRRSPRIRMHNPSAENNLGATGDDRQRYWGSL